MTSHKDEDQDEGSFLAARPWQSVKIPKDKLNSFLKLF